MYWFVIIFFLTNFSSIFSDAEAAIEQDKKYAVIYVYNRIDEDYSSSTSIRFEKFEAHIRELIQSEYTVLPLPDIIEALKNNEDLPNKTIAITFDGGHSSIADKAIPLLQKNGIPYTIFISTQKADHNNPNYLSWQTLKRFKKNKLTTIGIHSASYTYLSGKKIEEIQQQVNSAKSRYREEFGHAPELFAYPFGDYDLTTYNIIKTQGFSAAFGQQSGVAYAGHDIYSLPRFTMTDNFGSLERFQTTASSLPLPFSDIQPSIPYLDNNTPSIGFTIDPTLEKETRALSCFVSGIPAAKTDILAKTRVEIRLPTSFENERTRINCTLPVVQNNGSTRWRWLGMLFTLPENPL